MYVFTDSRFCHIQYGDLEDHIHNYDGKTPHNAWNEEEYDAHKIQEEIREDEMDIVMAEEDFALNLFNEYGDPSDSDNSSGNNCTAACCAHHFDITDVIKFSMCWCPRPSQYRGGYISFIKKCSLFQNLKLLRR